MIGLLRGKVITKQPPELLLEVQGVGYELLASMNTFYALPMESDSEITIFTHLVVREDAHTLFGFVSQEERTLFRHLLKVNGVGSKMALTIVSGMTSMELSHVIHAGDTASLSRIPGIGKKTAERLIVELRDRLPKPEASPATGNDSGKNNLPSEAITNEALNALLALGYKLPQAEKMLQPYKNQLISVEEMIRLALKSSLA